MRRGRQIKRACAHHLAVGFESEMERKVGKACKVASVANNDLPFPFPCRNGYGGNGLFELKEARVGGSVGIDQAVLAEVHVVGIVAEVAAVGVFGGKILVRANRHTMVGKFPNATAHQLFVCPNEIPIVFEIPGAVAHGMAILAKVDGARVARVLQEIFKPLHSHIHKAFNIEIVAGLDAFFLFAENAMMRHTGFILCMHDARGIAAAEIFDLQAVV